QGAQSTQGMQRTQDAHNVQQAARHSPGLTRIRSTLLGDPVDLGRTHGLLGAIANDTGQRDVALQHLNTALSFYERYERLREIAHVCNNIGHVYLKLGRYSQARTNLQRAYSLAERTGDTPLMSVVMHNLAELAYASGEGSQQEAEDLYKHSLRLAEQINDREYLSHWNAEYALLLLRRGDHGSAAPHIQLALSIARAIRNMPCTGLALVALGAFRLAQARHCNDGREATYRSRARHSLQRALALPGLEVETRSIGEQTLREV
ncbi:MAG TPA: tetratricopeptide repeat protein, partial [Ktedonobacteraceae bacterium]|nr:tetratricopeptide repeat protein [Ktedonobacteraceae bacterium]